MAEAKHKSWGKDRTRGRGKRYNQGQETGSRRGRTASVKVMEVESNDCGELRHRSSVSALDNDTEEHWTDAVPFGN